MDVDCVQDYKYKHSKSFDVQLLHCYTIWYSEI